MRLVIRVRGLYVMDHHDEITIDFFSNTLYKSHIINLNVYCPVVLSILHY